MINEEQFQASIESANSVREAVEIFIITALSNGLSVNTVINMLKEKEYPEELIYKACKSLIESLN